MLSVATKVSMVALNGVAAYFTYDAVMNTAKLTAAPLRPSYTKEVATTLGVLATAGLAYGLYKRRTKKVLMVKKSKEMLTAESMRAESELDSRSMPACQVVLALKEGDILTPVGCGIRTEYGIWTLDHIVANLSKVWLIRDAVQIEIDLDNTPKVEFGLESVCLVIDDSKMSRLGLQKAKFGPLPKDGKMVVVVGPYGQGSMGMLQRSHFGHVMYQGSTTAGFSGSPYMYNKTVIGMHSHGGKENGGMEILYLKAMYHLNENIVLENSEDYFKNFVEKNDDLYYEEVGDDIVVADDDGHFHVAKGDLARTVKQARRLKKTKAYTPADYNAEYVPGGWADQTDEVPGWSQSSRIEPDDFKPESAPIARNAGPFLGEAASKPVVMARRASPKPVPRAQREGPRSWHQRNERGNWSSRGSGYAAKGRNYPYTGRPQYLTYESAKSLIKSALGEVVEKSSLKQKDTSQPIPAKEQ